MTSVVPHARVATLALVALGVPAAVLLLFFAVVPRGATVVYTWPAAFYAQVLCLSPLVLTALAAWRGWWVSPGGLVPWAFGMPALVLVVSALTSRLPWFSLEAALPPSFGLGVAWLVSGVAPRWRAHTAFGLAVLAAAGVFASVVGYLPSFVLQMAEFGWEGWARVLVEARNPHPAGHWNYTGGYALLAIPWLVVTSLRVGGPWRVLGWAGVGAGVFSLVTSGSRGAVLGAAGAVVAAFLLAASVRRWSWRAVAVGACGALAAVTLLVYSNPRLRALAIDPGRASALAEGDVQRLAMLEAGWLLLLREPWLGHGPGLVPVAYPEVRGSLVGGVESAYQLHSAPVHLAAETGLAGLASCLLFPAAVVRAWRRRERVAESVPWARAAAVSITGYGVFALTDYQFHALAHAGLCGALAGWLVTAEAPALRPGRLPWWLGLAGPIAAACVLVPGWTARAVFSEAWRLSPPERLDALIKAAEAAPWNPHLWNHVGLEAAREAAAESDVAERVRLEETAAGALRRSLALVPAQEPVHAALGWLLLGRDAEGAARHFRAALRLLPDRSTLHAGLAIVSAREGRQEKAARFLALEAVADARFLAVMPAVGEALGVPAFLIDRELKLAWDEVVSSPDVPRWRRGALEYAETFALWWRHGTIPSEEALSGAPPLAARFFREAPLRERLGEAYPAPVRWLQAAAYGAAAEPPAGLSEAALAGARARLATRTGFLELVRRPAPGGDGVVTATVLRGHFAIFWRNLDGPGYLDLAPRTYDAFAQEFLGFLFPSAGQVPGPLWRELRREE